MKEISEILRRVETKDTQYALGAKILRETGDMLVRNGLLSLSVGEDSVDVEAKVVGEENEIAFNAKYLLDVLTNLEKEDIVFEMTGPLNPGVFKIKEDSSFLHLIMPIRVQG